MARITQIKSQKKSGRFNIYLDGRFAFGLSAETLTKTGLSVDQELSEKQIKELAFKNEFQKLYDKALRFLSFRSRSEKEIRDYLERKIRNQKDLVNRIIKRLKEQKLIDDQAFAAWWCLQRNQFRPRGKRMLTNELWQKGVDDQIAREVVEEMVDEEKLARKIIQKKIKTLQKLSFKDRKQKLTQFLARRGFSWEAIKKIIDSFFQKE